jgi:hypothetical protein
LSILQRGSYINEERNFKLASPPIEYEKKIFDVSGLLAARPLHGRYVLRLLHRDLIWSLALLVLQCFTSNWLWRVVIIGMFRAEVYGYGFEGLEFGFRLFMRFGGLSFYFCCWFLNLKIKKQS